MTALLRKAEVLDRLQGRLKAAAILPLCRISALSWRQADAGVISQARSFLDSHAPLIVRSSSASEDIAERSNAGMFLSIKGLSTWPELAFAIDKVIGSYRSLAPDDEVLLQPVAQFVTVAGVAMTRDPETGMPYCVIEYSTDGGTDAVTSGAGCLRSHTVAALDAPVPQLLEPLMPAIAELELIFDGAGIDVEFAITPDRVLVFQCRPIVWRQRPPHLISRAELETRAADVAAQLKSVLRSNPGECPGETVLGTMPDWNPAEMIGLKPRPLALSLYQHLITDSVWSAARASYGYADVGAFPLMRAIAGTPYIDVRASCRSFTPASIHSSLATEMVDGAIERLRDNPHLFDKLEFSVIPTCLTPSLELANRSDWGIAQYSDWRLYLEALGHLTRRIIHPGGLFDRDQNHAVALARAGAQASPKSIRAAVSLIDQIRASGTPCFARVARAAFVATAIIKSLEVETGSLDLCERLLGSVETVASRVSRDFRSMSRDAILAQHGHVRPGTYDVRVPRYDEQPEKYFDWNCTASLRDPIDRPAVTYANYPEAARCLITSQLGMEFDSFVAFAQKAIAAREEVKYHFTRLLSDALVLLCGQASALGLSRDQLSFLTLQDLRRAASVSEYSSLVDVAANREAVWLQHAALRVPPVITRPEDALSFNLWATPNFITREVAEGHVTTTDCVELPGSIVLLETADPGFDWLFSRGIAGFITAFGGENSHMAIRAREFGLPAVIGAGETYYRRWRNASRIRIDCETRRVEMLT